MVLSSAVINIAGKNKPFSDRVWLFFVLCVLCFTAGVKAQESEQEPLEQDHIEPQQLAVEPLEPEIVDGYRTVEWVELIPQADLDALLNPPEELMEIEDGSTEDQISSELKAQLDAEKAQTLSDTAKRYHQALSSTNIIADFNEQSIRVAGFVVPLAFGDGQQQITEFFLVPYFGACIHVPPPPPNQIIYGKYPASFKLASLSQPYWIYGKLKTSIVENETATSAYSFVVEKVVPYTEYNG